MSNATPPATYCWSIFIVPCNSNQQKRLPVKLLAIRIGAPLACNSVTRICPEQSKTLSLVAGGVAFVPVYEQDWCQLSLWQLMCRVRLWHLLLYLVRLVLSYCDSRLSRVYLQLLANFPGSKADQDQAIGVIILNIKLSNVLSVNMGPSEKFFNCNYVFWLIWFNPRKHIFFGANKTFPPKFDREHTNGTNKLGDK